MRLVCAALCLFAAACDNGVSCNTGPADVAEVCLPATIAPDVASVIDVRELCGNACAGLPSCTAIFRNGTVSLQMEAQVCSDNLTSSCLDSGCREAAVRCVLPALHGGQYPLQFPGGPSRMLRVAPGGVSSCRFTQPADGGVQ